MKQSEVNRFNRLYKRQLKKLKLQGKAQKTLDTYARSTRRTRDYFDCCPDKLKPEQLENHFADLVEFDSGVQLKIDRLELQYFCAEKGLALGGHCQTSQG